jgi:FkbM family methyltransferase
MQIRELSRKVAKVGARAVVKGLNLDVANRLTCNLVEEISPIYHLRTPSGEFRLHCPNALTHWRAKTFLTKETETIEWIETFQPGELFFDIGANVGLYAIYAGSRGVDTWAFEPESQNCALLNQNIFLNNLSTKVRCLSVAISDRDSLDYLYMPTFRSGGAINTFGDSKDENHQPMDVCFRQGGISFSLDSFLERFGEGKFPDHIKIDVDGLEMRILQGAKRTLEDTRLKSLSIEINERLPESTQLVEYVKARGLEFSQRKHSDLFETGPYKDIYNYVFRRPR